VDKNCAPAHEKRTGSVEGRKQEACAVRCGAQALAPLISSTACGGFRSTRTACLAPRECLREGGRIVGGNFTDPMLLYGSSRLGSFQSSLLQSTCRAKFLLYDACVGKSIRKR